MRISSSKLSSLASRMSARTRGARPALLTSASTAPYRSATAAASRARSGGGCRRRPGSSRRGRRASSSTPRDVVRVAHAAQRQRPAVGGERSRDAEPDAAGAAGDEGDRWSRRGQAPWSAPRGQSAGPKNVRYGSSRRDAAHEQRGLAQVIVAPLARFAARDARARPARGPSRSAGDRPSAAAGPDARSLVERYGPRSSSSVSSTRERRPARSGRRPRRGARARATGAAGPARRSPPRSCRPARAR